MQTAPELGDFVANVGIHIPAPWFGMWERLIIRQPIIAKF
jgi:hypothetical protein